MGWGSAVGAVLVGIGVDEGGGATLESHEVCEACGRLFVENGIGGAAEGYGIGEGRRC